MTKQPLVMSQAKKSALGYPGQAWVVCFTAALFFFFIFIQLNMFNALSPHLIKSFNLNTVQLGRLSAEYFYADVLFLFPAGMILDRFSTRWVISINMGLTVIFTGVFAIATSLWQLEVSRFIIGLVGAFCLLSCVRLASRWFPPQRMALVIGLVVTFAMLGGMVAQTPFAILTDEFGWRSAMLANTGLGFLIFLLILLLVRDYPPAYKATEHHAQHALQSIGIKKSIYMTVGNLQNWLAGLFASFLNLPIFLLGALWGGMYLMQARGLSRNVSTTVTMMLFIGFVIGSPLVGWLSDKIRKRRLPMLVGALFSLVVMLLIICLPTLSVLSLIILFILLGVGISAQVIAYPLVAESNPPSLTGSAEGMASVLIMAGGFTQPLYALLLNWGWRAHYVAGMPVYSHTNFIVAMSIMPLTMLLGLVAAFFIRETNCINPHE